MMCSNLVNINVYAKIGKIISICSKDIERKRKSEINEGPYNTLILSISMHIQNLVKLYQLVLKILSGNEILNTIPTSVKGLNSVTNVRKMMCNNPILDLDKIYAYTKFGKSLLIFSQDIERKQIYDGRNDENTE